MKCFTQRINDSCKSISLSVLEGKIASEDLSEHADVLVVRSCGDAIIKETAIPSFIDPWEWFSHGYGYYFRKKIEICFSKTEAH